MSTVVYPEDRPHMAQGEGTILTPEQAAAGELISQDVDPGAVMLDIVKNSKQALDFNIAKSILDMTIRETMAGAPTVTIVVHDPDLILLNARGVLWDIDKDGDRVLKEVIVKIDNRKFMLIAMEWDDASAGAGVDITIKFEHMVVWALRQHKRYRKVSRAKSTLAEFMRTFAREVKAIDIRFSCSQLHKKQPIKGLPKDDKKKIADERREPGLADDADITVKGRKATRKQLDTIESVLKEGDRLGVKKKLQIVAVMVITQESVAGVKRVSSSGKHHGAFHQDSSYGTVKQRNDDTHAANGFFKKAKAYDAKTPNAKYEQLAERVQVSGNPAAYATWREEAEKTVSEFSGSGKESKTIIKTFNYTRGEPDEVENSWDCSQRYADLVNWRSFVTGANTWVFDSEPALFKSRARFTLERSNPAVYSMSADLDENKPVKTMTVIFRVRLWKVPPGSVVVVKGEGAANGRWLVEEIERSRFNDRATVVLVKPTKPKAEPAPETSSVSTPERGDKIAGSKLTYPLAKHGDRGGGPADHASRAFGNWQSDNAVDILVEQGTNVFAVADGTIQRLGGAWRGGSGNPDGFNVTLNCGKNGQWFYTHLRSRTDLKVGQRVKAGQYLGKSGAANGVAHLHIACRPSDGDPVKLLKV